MKRKRSKQARMVRERREREGIRREKGKDGIKEDIKI